MAAPHRIQQIRYLVPPGSPVTAGQHIASMYGPEVHHFLTEFEVTRQRLAALKQRYERNRSLYESRAIDEAKWLEISEAYLTLQLEYEHLLHFRELLIPAAQERDGVTLIAPDEGVLIYRQASPGIEPGEELALLLPPDSLRLAVQAPLAGRSTLDALAADSCELAVASVDGVATDFFVEVWSEPLQAACRLLPGERLMVRPYYRVHAYRLPRAAVFQWQGRPAVLLREGQTLRAVNVELLSGDDSNYAVACPTDIAGGTVLTSSVSAVQGMLLGLGGE